MIKFPTVLVLGAGASIPYGFPSGAELKKIICEVKFPPSFDSSFSSLKVSNFVNAFRNSHVNSIDSFLARRSEYVGIGKAIIANIISRKEDIEYFNLNIEDDWYALLWNKLVADVHSIEDFAKNNLKIITFNYDRSLEAFLLTSFCNTFGVETDIAKEALKGIRIIHFYGHLGELSQGYSKTELPYKNNHSDSFIFQAAGNIKIIPEHRDNLETNVEIESWFVEARNIFFLGFGFDALNITRLGLKETFEKMFNSNTEHITVMASTYKLTASEASLAGTLLLGKAKTHSWDNVSQTCSGTLRHYAEKFV
ncbi:hypothetical protein [Methylotenera sp. 1P/1]|uniref:hypothetical protein n=1 Tax=Methylotenera sp. 1P/1 TaxID=1131551 RepID=UPI000382B62C|nr:hypothetical protein [Methylotenera sp. 1P/1]